MLISLVGVVQDGSPIAPGVPYNNRTTLTLPRGANATVRLSIVTTMGTLYPVEYVTSVLTVKRAPDDSPAQISIAGVANPLLGPNVIDFTFVPGSTASPLISRRGTYDIWVITLGGERIQVMPVSPFVLQPTVLASNAPIPPPPAPAQALDGTVPAPGGPYYAIAQGTPVSIVDGVLVESDAGIPSTMPCVGLYTGSTTNRVRTDGEEMGLSGLPENVKLYIAVGGGLTATAPSGSGQVSQRIGESVGTTGVFVAPEDPIFF